MKIQVKRKVSLILVICSLFLLTACGGEKQINIEDNSSDSNIGMIYIYYPSGNSVVKEEQQYQLKHPDSITLAFEEVILESTKYFNDTVQYNTYMLDDDNNLNISFSLQGDLDKEYFLLMQASLVKTLFQINDIGDIVIRLTDNIGSEVSYELFNEESFYFYGYPDEYANEEKIVLYVSNEDGNALVRKTVKVVMQDNQSKEEKIVELLEEEGAIPANTTIKSIAMHQTVCYIDLSTEFGSGIKMVKSEIVLYSLVNSLTTLEGIYEVKILIDGKERNLYRETVPIKQPLMFNVDIVEG